ncbi:MAG: DUF177 domain-containing protein [Candidatus Omnitrophica bacterium]|nr:DUF177 domain-containing protein [Candidatus Omnitrophota bacterium]
MKIYIRRIPPQGITLQEQESIGLPDNLSGDIKFIAPFDISAKVDKTQDTLLVETTVKSRFQSFCFRCLQDIEKDLCCSFLLDYTLDRQTDFIDITEDLRQEVILGLPSLIICDETCKGLCPKCGNNLNEGKCLCLPNDTKKIK